jgi:sugar lactone lactonase YvrE
VRGGAAAIVKKILLFLLVLLVVLMITVRIRYGGGQPYADLSTTPILNSNALEKVLSYPEPIGNVAVSSSGRVFFTVHPESRTRGNKLLEFVDGASVPFPSGALQRELFDTVLGVVIDRQNRLWTIDHGNHGMRAARLLAFDLSSGTLIHDTYFDKSIAPAGSFLQDLQVSADGRTIVIADTSFWRKKPALIVYDIETDTARRVLEEHPTVSAEDHLITHQDRAMSFLGGIVVLRGGVDGIALAQDWLYFAALSGSSLYRIDLASLRDRSIPDSQLARHVERYADKPLSDGLSVDVDGNVYVTDVEHNSINIVGADRELRTLMRSPEIRWPDALSFGPEGWLYVADSDLPDVVLMTRDHIKAQAPYGIFRFQVATQGVPGQ